MKLVIQIPCWNEEETLPRTLADLPRAIEGIDEIEILVIDDGSEDRTAEVARAHGVDRVVRLTAHQGLARAFARGLEEALALGADLIVNTDADNQYRGADLPLLVRPILEGRADMVVGDRRVESVESFSSLKKRLQKIGSAVVRRLSGTAIADATSGFRAYSREAALRITVVSRFTYTLETILQAVEKGIVVESVPVRTNPPTRRSRLFRSIPAYLRRSLATMTRIYLLYQPARVLLAASAVFGVLALGLFVRFAYFYVQAYPEPSGHAQSVIVGGVLAVIGVLLGALGVLSDLIAINRRLLEEILTHARALRLDARRRDRRSP